MRALILIAHGSRIKKANDDLLRVVESVKQHLSTDLVLPAYLELANPDLPTAIDSAVELGADQVVILPFFLLNGAHVQEDIPRLVSEAGAVYPDLQITIGDAIGYHQMMAEILVDSLKLLL